MMMGYAGMGLAVPWLFGVIAVVVIWAVVWWMVTALGVVAPREQVRPPARPQLSTPQWRQPDFGQDAARPQEADQGTVGQTGEWR